MLRVYLDDVDRDRAKLGDLLATGEAAPDLDAIEITGDQIGAAVPAAVVAALAKLAEHVGLIPAAA